MLLLRDKWIAYVTEVAELKRFEFHSEIVLFRFVWK